MTSTILPPLYKRDTTGGIRVWRLELDEDLGKYRTLSGTLDGKMAESGWTHAVPKNVGRSNETTASSQAHAEASAEYTKKLDRGYFHDVADVDRVEFVKPMLAQDWAKVKVQPTSGFAQPKLDGIRCIARADGLRTRTGQPITAVPHILEALAPVFALDPDAVLDGELYNHDFKDDFNQITSAVRKQKPTAAELAHAASVIQYHMYDQVSRDSFDDRVLGGLGDLMYRAFPGLTTPDCLHLVPTEKFTSLEKLDELYGKWLEDGYEGQMIRNDGPYEAGKRSKNLLKRKEFITAEFPVVAVEEGIGNWSGAAKKFRLTLPTGVEFGAGVRGKKGTLEALLIGPKPDWATVRYFTPTPDGIPRFPVVTDWGFGVRKD